MKKGKTDQQVKLDKLRGRYQQLKKEKAKSNAAVREMMRLKALMAYYAGMKPETVAKCYGVGLKSFKQWLKKFEAEAQVSDNPRSGRPAKLSPPQQETLKAIITRHKEQVWTARHVYILLEAVFTVCYAPKYLPELLRSLGLSYHKAIHTLAKKNNAKRQKWIKETLPALYAKLVQEAWRLFSVDEVGFQTEGTLAYSWGLKGEKTEIDNYGRHGRVNLIGAFELGSGQFYGVLTSFRVNAQRFRRFVCHLKREMPTDKLILICDNASFHKAKWVKEWYQQQQAWLHVEFLPGYSPDFNPIERLWRWLKTEYIHNQCWASKKSLKKYLQCVCHNLSHQTEEVKSVMRQEMERLKLTFDFYDTPCPFTLPA
jgi:transposase